MWAYIALFGWSFLAATVLPLGSEPAVIGLVRQGHSVAAIVIIATAGNYLGACTTYWIGRGAATALQNHRRKPREMQAARLVARYGAPTLLLSWVPILGDAVVVAAGIAQIEFWSFSAWTAVGKLARYIVVAWAFAPG